jgi:16S rRNA (guanine(966)-N(2))-methyltransferase RsmD
MKPKIKSEPKTGMKMRIVAGTARGTVLETIDGEETRPTLGRVKENFFNAIAFEIEGAHVLDLFAGSGQLGLEALSRGAKDCVFVDCDAECVEIIRRNAQKAKLYQQCNVYKSEYSEYLSGLRKRRDFETGGKFDIIFLDPPYNASGEIIPRLVSRLAEQGFIAENGLIICETERPFELDDKTVKRVVRTRNYKYGRVLITVLNIGAESEKTEKSEKQESEREADNGGD